MGEVVYREDGHGLELQPGVVPVLYEVQEDTAGRGIH